MMVLPSYSSSSYSLRPSSPFLSLCRVHRPRRNVFFLDGRPLSGAPSINNFLSAGQLSPEREKVPCETRQRALVGTFQRSEGERRSFRRGAGRVEEVPMAVKLYGPEEITPGVSEVGPGPGRERTSRSQGSPRRWRKPQQLVDKRCWHAVPVFTTFLREKKWQLSRLTSDRTQPRVQHRASQPFANMQI